MFNLFYNGSTHSIRYYYPKLVFLDDAPAVFMSIAGFIVATYKAGNIRLAEDLAESINYVFTSLAGRGDTFAEIAPDVSCMSFTFILYAKAQDQSIQEYYRLKEKYELEKGPYVKRVGYWEFDKTTGVKIYNGGIIFHYGQALHKLDSFTDRGRAWSVHT